MDMCCANRVSLLINYEFKQLKFECFIEVFYGFYTWIWIVKYIEESFFCFSVSLFNWEAVSDSDSVT